MKNLLKNGLTGFDLKYLALIFMGLIRFGFYNVLDFAVRGDGFFPLNAMLSSFVVLLVVLMGIDWIREKKYFIGILAVKMMLVLCTSE